MVGVFAYGVVNDPDSPSSQLMFDLLDFSDVDDEFAPVPNPVVEIPSRKRKFGRQLPVKLIADDVDVGDVDNIVPRPKKNPIYYFIGSSSDSDSDEVGFNASRSVLFRWT